MVDQSFAFFQKNSWIIAKIRYTYYQWIDQIFMKCRLNHKFLKVNLFDIRWVREIPFFII